MSDRILCKTSSSDFGDHIADAQKKAYRSQNFKPKSSLALISYNKRKKWKNCKFCTPYVIKLKRAAQNFSFYTPEKLINALNGNIEADCVSQPYSGNKIILTFALLPFVENGSIWQMARIEF